MGTKVKEITERLFEISEEMMSKKMSEMDHASLQEELRDLYQQLDVIHKELLAKTRDSKYDPMARESIALEQRISDVEEDKEIANGLLANLPEKKVTQEGTKTEEDYFDTAVGSKKERETGYEEIADEEVEEGEYEEVADEEVEAKEYEEVADEEVEEGEYEEVADEEVEEGEYEEVADEEVEAEEYEEVADDGIEEYEEATDGEIDQKEVVEKAQEQETVSQASTKTVLNQVVRLTDSPSDAFINGAFAIIGARKEKKMTLSEAIREGEGLSRQLMQKLQTSEEKGSKGYQQDYDKGERSR